MQNLKMLAARGYDKCKSAVKGATAGAAGLAIEAHAAVPTEVTTAISDGTADGKTIAYALLAFAVAVGVIMYLKRKGG